MARKRFGQNFLIDKAIIFSIIDAIQAKPKQHIVEIGPGHGALTKHLIKSKAKVDAIEIDRDLVAQLQTIADKNFQVHSADILEFDLHSLRPFPLRVVGNLPYNISTPLLFNLFKNLEIISDMYFMLQQEVAIRLVAKPNCKDYGKLSIMAQYYCDIEIVMHVPPNAFSPQPKVESNIVKLIPNKVRPKVNVKLLNQTVSTAFNQRRKTIANSLNELLNKEDLVQLNLNPKLRAENLSLEDYLEITSYLDKK